LLSKHPSIAAAWNNNAIENAMRIIRQSLRLQAIILVMMLLGGIFLGEWLIHTFLKIDVPNYYLISIPLILSSVIWQMALLIHKPLEMAHKSSHMIVFILLSLGSNCVLNMILIPRYGVVAAGFTTLFSTLLYVALTLVKARNILIKLR
jgi:O-antigen/teichoic acid export membrane protein